VPGDPEAFPTLYYLPIETPNNDRITYIGMVNNVCLVGLNNSIVRLNYLPSEDDASFTRTRIYDFISRDLGILSPRAACTFLSPEGRELMACVTQDGLYVTDGFSFMKWDQDYTFVASILTFMPFLSGAGVYDARWLQLTNDISTGNLLLTYVDYNASSRFFILPFSYAARHLKPGPKFKVGLPLTGSVAGSGIAAASFTTVAGLPVTYVVMNASSASKTIALLNMGSLNYTAMSEFTPAIVTRTMQLVEGFDDAVVQSVYLHSGAAIAATTTVRATTSLLDTLTTTSSSAVAFTGGLRVSKADLQFTGYQTSFRITINDSGLNKLNRIAVEYDRLT
jgi:hypothetical protein